MSSVLIRGGTVVNADASVVADVPCHDGLIRAIGPSDPAAYQRTVKVLLAGGSDPVIKKDPGSAAWTHAVTDKALGK